MNIYIPDIKLPKDEPGAFEVIVMYVGADKKLRAECEGTHEVTIVPPHGDLIDMDSEIDVYDRYDDDIIRPSTVRDLINDFISGKYPRTIIKAEK